MKVKIFQADGYEAVKELEERINQFLAKLPSTAVQHTDTALCAISEEGEGAPSYRSLVVTIWYTEK